MCCTGWLTRNSTPAARARWANCSDTAPMPSEGNVAAPSPNIFMTSMNKREDCSESGARYMPSKKGLKNMQSFTRSKALRAKKAALRGEHNTGTRKIRTTVHFDRPRTLRLPRKPRYPRHSGSGNLTVGMKRFEIIKHPLTTESAMRKIEDNNTLVFIVNRLANKFEIKKAVAELYGITVPNVCTLNKPDGMEKVYT